MEARPTRGCRHTNRARFVAVGVRLPRETRAGAARARPVETEGPRAHGVTGLFIGVGREGRVTCDTAARRQVQRTSSRLGRVAAAGDGGGGLGAAPPLGPIRRGQRGGERGRGVMGVKPLRPRQCLLGLPLRL